MTEHQHTIIIGAGLAGLAAAYHLQAKGKKVLIIEATDSVGGRIKTELYNGFRLDVGFQVLLTHYPEAQKMLDYDALNLRYFDNGALIFGADTPPYTIADALRQPAALPKMLLSPVGSIIDKLRLAMLVYKLRKQSIDHIFQKNEMPTHQILRKYGFSSKIIQRFFMPFMRGIFLEPKLDTSSHFRKAAPHYPPMVCKQFRYK
jgi:phytoene dehydrogenase-like protein